MVPSFGYKIDFRSASGLVADVDLDIAAGSNSGIA